MQSSRSQRPSDRLQADAGIEPLAAAHIPDLVRLHELCYPTQFATRLGGDVLGIVYRAYCEDPNAVGLVAIVHGHVVAMVCGVIGGGFKGRMVRRHGPALAWQLARRLLRDPRTLPEIVRRLAAGWRPDRSGMSDVHPRRFVWRSQMVHPEWRGRGTIFPLIDAMIEALRQRGVEEIYSTPDEDNQAANWVHRVLKFEKCGTQVASHGKRQSVFVLKLAGEQRS
jgi:GNAT superfamily N-acetyltransferase